MIARLLTAAAVAGLALGAAQLHAEPAGANPIIFPGQFDSIGTPKQSFTTREGRTVHFTATGGAYAGHIVQAMAGRIASWHMLAAVASAQANVEKCRQDEAVFAAQLGSQVATPRIWREMPKDGVAAKVPGFTALAPLPSGGAYTRDD